MNKTKEKISGLIDPFLQSQSIPPEEVQFHAHSFADPGGRLFFWGDQLYRGIRSAQAPFFRELFENGIISNLVKKGLLIETDLTHFTFNEYAMVVHHRSVPFASYPQEWCPPMFKDAALAIVDLAIELANGGLTLKDAHPWNVLFDECKPVYVDLGSIAPLDDASMWSAYPEFCRYCLYPLILMSQGHDRIARLLMCEEGGVLEAELYKLAPRLAIPAYVRRAVLRLIPGIENGISSVSQKMQHNQKLLRRFLEQVRQQVKDIPLASFEPKKADLENHANQMPEPHNVLTEREAVERMLLQLKPDSVLDINSGTGRLAKLAANLGSRVVAFDTDLESVSHLYREARTNRLPILPLVMDFTKPTPARGIGNHWMIAATDRFQCDLVLALGLMNQPMPLKLGFDQIINGLSQFSRRWLVIELPSDGWIPVLEQQFRNITRITSTGETDVLLLCEK